MTRKVLVTGGAGFIGSAVCRHLVGAGVDVLNLDALTYAGNLKSLATIDNAPNYRFARIDVCDRRAVDEAFAGFAPDHVIHLAAESHVDRSITGQRRVHPNQHRRNLHHAGGGARLLARARAAEA